MAKGKKPSTPCIPPDLLAHLSLEKVLQTIPSGVFVVDRGQKIVHWNAEAERLTGYSAAEAIGRHCSFLGGIPCGRACGLYDEHIPKPVTGIRCSIRARDGRRITLLKNVDYLRGPAGEIIGGVESFNEITRLTQLEERLRRQTSLLKKAVENRTRELEIERTWLRTVLDAMPDLAYIADSGYRMRFMNRAMAERFGDREGEICHQALHDLGAPCSWCPMRKVLEGETIREERQFGEGGQTYEILHTPLRAADGTVHKLAVFRDITHRKRLEEDLRATNRELDAYVSMVSHDLRTPLTPIIGYADFLREQYHHQLDQQALDCLQEIENQAQKALALMEDLLALSRIGRVEPPAEPVKLERIVAETLDELRQNILERGARVEVSRLPALRIPPTLLSELFSNLIDNAVRYAGGPDALIEIGSVKAGKGVRIFVRDHGPGIPAEERERIFELFYRGSAPRKTPGTGIGLAIVRKIARLYGGDTRVEGTPGGGCTFVLEFPAKARQ